MQMLLDSLKSTNSALQQLNVRETAVQDAKKKAKNDQDYSQLVSDFYNSVRTLKYSHDLLGYSVSAGVIQSLNDTCRNLQKAIESGVVDEEILSKVKKQKNSLHRTLEREWKTFYEEESKGVFSKLDLVESLVPNKSHIEYIRNRIRDCEGWVNLSDGGDFNSIKIANFNSSLDEVGKLEEQLSLDDNIKEFIARVTKGNANITDLSEDVVRWIREKNLGDKFSIVFK